MIKRVICSHTHKRPGLRAPFLNPTQLLPGLRQLAYTLSGTPSTPHSRGLGDKKKVTDLVDEMIVTGPIEITMQSKVAECFPWRFIGVDGLASVG